MSAPELLVTSAAVAVWLILVVLFAAAREIVGAITKLQVIHEHSQISIHKVLVRIAEAGEPKAPQPYPFPPDVHPIGKRGDRN